MPEEKKVLKFSQCYVNKGNCWVCGRNKNKVGKDGFFYVGLDKGGETVLVPLCEICLLMLKGEILTGVYLSPEELNIDEHIKEEEKGEGKDS